MKNKKLLRCAVLSSILAMGIAGSAFAEETNKEELNSFMFDTVVVTANRYAERITDVTADVSVVSRQEIEEMHMESVEEVLRTVPGVQFTNYGSNGMNANISGLRINGSKDIVVLVDGVRVSDFQGTDSGGYMYASLLSNMDNIERVEVLRGAAGTVYGSGAKGGVINIITRKIEDNKTTIDISGGSFGKENYKLNTMGRNGKVGYNVYYNESLSGDMEDGAGVTWKGDSETKNFGLKVNYDINEDQTLTVSYDHTDSDYSGQDLVYHKDYKGDYKTSNFTLQHDYKINKLWNNRLVYRHNDVVSNYKQFETNGKQSLDSPQDVKYDFISEQATFSDGTHTVVFGLDYSSADDNIERSHGYDSGGNVVLGKNSMKNYSFYIQDDWKVLPKFTLSGGLRYDRPDMDGVDFDNHLSKSYKVSYDISENDTIYAGRSDFYIMPSMSQLFDTAWGNRDLKANEGHTTSIGYNKQFDDRNLLTLSWFKTESDNFIGYNEDNGYININGATSKGWNLQYMTQIGNNWNANIGWAHLKHNASGDNLTMGYYPEDMLTFGVYYDYHKVSAGLNGYYFMRAVNDDYKNGWPADDYAVVNLSVNYKPTKEWKLYAKVDNLFDKLYAEHTNVIHGGQPDSWYSMPGRSIIVGAEFSF